MIKPQHSNRVCGFLYYFLAKNLRTESENSMNIVSQAKLPPPLLLSGVGTAGVVISVFFTGVKSASVTVDESIMTI